MQRNVSAEDWRIWAADDAEHGAPAIDHRDRHLRGRFERATDLRARPAHHREGFFQHGAHFGRRKRRANFRAVCTAADREAIDAPAIAQHEGLGVAEFGRLGEADAAELGAIDGARQDRVTLEKSCHRDQRTGACVKRGEIGLERVELAHIGVGEPQGRAIDGNSVSTDRI